MRRRLAVLAVALGLALGISSVPVTPIFAHGGAQTDEKTQTFVGSRKSNVYHRPNCSAAGRIKPENLISFKTKAEAEKAGYRPCKICKP